MLTGTVEDWKMWYAENRSEDCKLISAIDAELSDETPLVRLWNAQDGKKPKQGIAYGSSAWVKNAKGRKTSRVVSGLAIITAPGQPPLILAEPNGELVKELLERDAQNNERTGKKGGRGERTSAKPKKGGRKLNPPYLWVCRDCGHEFEAETPEIHCTRLPRQVANCSEDADAWFDDFLGRIKWTYAPHSEIIADLAGIVDDEEARAFAEEAGKSLEEILNKIKIEKPKKFQLYNEQTRFLRVSDLKDEVKFKRVINNIPKWRKKKLTPLRKAPLGPIELGHAFDELLTSTFTAIDSQEWSEGERMRFDCEELQVTVSGTPDLVFQGVPVETKTVRLFPHEVSDEKKVKSQKATFKTKWKRNYSKQVAIYLQGVEKEWMLLLIISRQSGLFTVVPVDTHAMKRMRNDWSKWAGKYAKQLDVYRALVDENSASDAPSEEE